MCRKYTCPASICCLRPTHATVARCNAKVSSSKLTVAVCSLSQLLWSCFNISSTIAPKRNRYITQRNQRAFTASPAGSLALQGHALALLSGMFENVLLEEIVFHYFLYVNITLNYQHKESTLRTKLLINKRFEMDWSFKRQQRKMKTCIFKQ